METRQRRTAPANSSSDLPPPRSRKKALRPVQKPLSNTRLTSVIYILVATSVLLGAFYAYRITVWKTEVGGWWNLMVGKKPPQMRTESDAQARGAGTYQTGSGKGDVEFHINQLASIFGIQPTDLASAISGAVKDHVAPKTLSSISSSASAKGAEKTAAQALFDDSPEKQGDAGGNGGIMETFEAVVGMDEPMGGLD